MSVASLTNLKTVLIQASRFMIIALMLYYTVASFTVYARSPRSRENVFVRQNLAMFTMHLIAFLVLYVEQGGVQILIFYGAQVMYLLATLLLMRGFYPRLSHLLLNNMCMLITIGLIMITRLSFDSAVRQFMIVAAGTVIALLIPVIVRKVLGLTRLTWAYVFVGIGLLGLVLVAASVTNGAKINIDIHGFTFQPSELVKIIYVFAIAGLICEAEDLKKLILAASLAAAHVLLLVVSKDLGSALIFFIAFLVVLFAGTKNPFLVLGGIMAGIIAGVAAYFLFYHVKVRVEVWLDPFADYTGKGFQICQSLFSLAAGGWLGKGLGLGSPGSIPFVQQDFMFSAVTEELGAVFAICLIAVCLSCFMMFVNIAMKLDNRFYRLVAVGLGTTYAAQVFLTVGGGMKLIPMTGVTLPLVSYGGSSALSTIAMFSIVQGLYMMRVDEVDRDEEEKRSGAKRYPDQGSEAWQ